MQMSLKQQICRGRLVYSGTDFTALSCTKALGCNVSVSKFEIIGWRISPVLVLIHEVSLQKDTVSSCFKAVLCTALNRVGLAGNVEWLPCLCQESRQFDSEPAERLQGFGEFDPRRLTLTIWL